MQDIHLDLSSVPEQMRRGYDGRKFSARVVKQVEIPIDSWLQSGDSRDTFRAVRIADGAEVALSSRLSPFDPARTGKVIQLTPGIAVVDGSKFQGKNMGLDFHVHADDARRMLPVAVELTAIERTH